MTAPELAPVPLSMAADALVRFAVAGGDGASLSGWLATLLERDPSAPATAATELGVDLDELRSRLARREGESPALPGEEVRRRAGQHAGAAGHPVASVGDLAWAILVAAAEAAPAAEAVPEPAKSERVPDAPPPPIAPAAPVVPPSAVAALASPAPGPAADERVVRVFISSTFRDMQAERDELVKRVFPELRQLCRARGVEFVEVDLRWGITREQAERGEVLPICLAEIARCRPYFIGLLGERYGWVPDALDPALAEQQPWLAERAGRSITELEILHGVLNDPAMADHAFFYFRDPAYGASVDPAQRPDLEPEDGGAATQLAALKERIRSSGLPVRTDYTDPRALGTLVLEDLRGAIEVEFPEGSEPDVWDRERAAHRMFARSRTRVYVGRSSYYERLDDHVRGDGPPLLVTGPAGAGKSALLANWAEHHRAQMPDLPLVYHAVSATPQGTDHVHLARRLAVELRRGAGGDDAERAAAAWVEQVDDEDLMRSLPSFLASAVADGRRVVLVLDGVDQLADAPGARELLWLPDELSRGVRVVVTARQGAVRDALGRRGWPILEIGPLDTDERAVLAKDYLWATYRKRLEPAQLERIVAAPQTASPLFLRALLEEVRVFGEFERVGQRVEHYLAAPTVLDLFGLVLERLEQDYQAEGASLVRRTMSAIWASRRGLTEPELLALTEIPRAVWSPLSLALEESLISRHGALGFFHDEFRSAVERRYLRDEGSKTAAHLRLADFFEASAPDARRAEELPYELAEAGAWERLAEAISDPVLADTAWEAEPAALRAWWSAVREHTGVTPPQAYAAVLASPANHLREQVWSIANLLMTMDYVDEALPVQRHLVDRSRAEGDIGRLQASLGNLGVSLFKLDRLEEALACHREEEAICRDNGYERELQKCLGNQVNVLGKLGRPDEGLALLVEAEALCRRLADPAQLAHRLFARAQLLGDKADLDGAHVALLEAGRLLESLSDREGLEGYIGTINDQGVKRKKRGQLKEAMECYREAERVSRLTGNAWVLQASLVNQGNVLGRWGEHDQADRLFEEAEAICRRLADRDALMRCIFNRAARLAEAGRPADAVPKAEEARSLAVELGQTDLLPHIDHLLDEARSRLW
jgi:nephrocystin-3